MVVKRFISIALAGLLAIGSINTGSVRAYAADEDLLLEEASFEDSGEELLEEELTEEPADEAGAEAVAAAPVEEEEVVEEEPAEEEAGEILGEEDDASFEASVQKYKVTITYYAEDGKTVNSNIAKAEYEKEAGDVLSGSELTLASIPDRSANPKTGYPSAYDANYDAKWVLMGSSSIVKMNDAGTALEMQANAKITSAAAISVKPVYTAKKYSVQYKVVVASGDLTPATVEAKIKASPSSYPVSYEFRDDQPFTFAKAPAQEFYTVKWYAATVTNEGTAEAPSYSFTQGAEVTDLYDGSAYSFYPGGSSNLFGFIAEYTVQGDQTFGYYGADETADADYTFGVTQPQADAITKGDVAYDYTFGATEPPAAYASDKTITLLNPTRVGYTFAGWYYFEDIDNDRALDAAEALKAVPSTTSGSTTTYKYTKTDGEAENIVFVPKWTANTYSLKFDNLVVADNTQYKVVSDMPSLTTITTDKEIKITAPKRANYKFVDWFINNSADSYVAPTTDPSPDPGNGLEDVDEDGDGTVDYWTYTLTAAKISDLVADSTATGGAKLTIKAAWGPKINDIVYSDGFGDWPVLAVNEPTYQIPDRAIEGSGSTPEYIFVSPLSKEGYTFNGWKVGNTALHLITDADVASEGAYHGVSDVNGNAAAADLYAYQLKQADTEGLTFVAQFTKKAASDTNKSKIIAINYKEYNDAGSLITVAGNDANRTEFTLIKEDGAFVTDEFFTIAAPKAREGYTFDGWYDAPNFVTYATRIALTTSDNPSTEDIDERVWKYTFSTDADDVDEVVASGVTLYAKWTKIPVSPTANYITLRFDQTDTNMKLYDSDDNQVTLGDWPNVYEDTGYALKASDLPSGVYKVGYLFDGWYTTNVVANQTDATRVAVGYKLAKDTDSSPLTVTVYPKFVPITYKITFVGTYKGSNKTVVTKEKVKEYAYDKLSAADDTAFRSIFTQSEIPNSAAAKFEAWRASAGTDRYAAGETIKAVIDNFNDDDAAGIKKASGSAVVEFKLTAEYQVTAEKYTVVFDATPTEADFVFDAYDFANSAYAPTAASDLRKSLTVTYDEDFILSGAEFVRKGYKLSKWNISVDGADAGTIAKNGKLNLDVMPNSVVTLKAVWTKDKAYTIKVVTNGGALAKGASIPKTYTYENPVALPQLTKKGYYHSGYSTDITATYGNVYSLGKHGSIEEGNVVLYAIFSERGYTINFDTNGGTYLDDVYAEYDETIKLADHITTRPGYKFAGWTTTINGKTKKYSAKQKISKLTDTSAQFVFKASWTPVKYSITYSSGKSAKLAKSAPKNFTPENAKTIVIPEPTRAGYTFDGWIVTGKSYDVPVEDAKNAKNEDCKKLSKQTIDGKQVYALREGDWGNIKLTADWIESTYTITLKKSDGTAIASPEPTIEGLYSAKAINFTEAASDASGLEKSIKGFALTADAKKAKYAIKKNYKMADIVTAAAKVQTTVDPADSAKTAITLYAVEEPAKFFAQTVVVSSDGDTLSDKTTTFTASKGTTISPKKVKGYTWEKTEVTGGADSDYTISNKGSVKIKGKASANKFVITMTYKPTTYKVVVMPNAKKVKYEGSTASSKGIAYAVDVPYNTDDTIKAADMTSLTRDGYVLVGFSKTKSAKTAAVAKADADGGLKLSSLKATKGVAKVYAIWKLDGVEHSIIHYPKVVNNENPDIDINANLKKAKGVSADYSYDVNDTDYVITSVYTKSLTLPKLTAPKGYKFLGWELVDGKESLVTKDKKSGYVKTIKKNTTESLRLIPVYQELTYKLSVNPNGGKYKGKKATAVLAKKVRYSEDIDKYLELIYGADMVKAGSRVNAVALKANPTKTSEFVTGSALKKTSNVTLYPIWEAKNAENVPTIAATYNGSNAITGLTATNLIDGDSYIIEISKDKSFATIDWTKTVDYADIAYGKYVHDDTNDAIGVTPANAYYIRICKVVGSTKGEWITATATVDAASIPVTIKYVAVSGSGDKITYSKDTTPTVTAYAVVGEYAKNVGVPSTPGYKSDGKLYTEKTADGKTTYEVVGNDVKIAAGASYFTLATVVEQKYYVRLSADNSAYDTSKDYAPYINMSKTYEVGKTTFGELGLTKPSINAAYGFTGWYLGGDQITDANGKVLDAKKDVKVSETKTDVSLVAKFSPITYKVQFLYKNDKGEEQIAATEHVVKYGEVFNLPAIEFISIPEGKLFNKWSMSAGLKSVGDRVYNLATTQDAVVKAYATFRASGTVNAKVKFVYPSGSKQDTKKVVTGSEEKLFKNVVGTTVSALEAPTGYTFATVDVYGDFTSNATPVAYVFKERTYDSATDDYYDAYVPAAEYSMSQVDTVYVPVMPMVYDVVFDAHGGGTNLTGINGVDYVTGADGSGDDAYAWDENGKSGTDTKLAKAGYKFDGWNTSADGKGIKVAAGSLLKGLVPQTPGTLTLYAQWKPITFTVKFYNKGGTGTINDITVTYDATGDDAKKAPKANAITKTGYKLIGWSNVYADTTMTGSGSTGTFKFAPEADIPSTPAGIVDGAVIRVYAVWEAKTVSSIAVKTPATKKTYYVGETFDPTGLVITATYTDNTTADIAYSNTDALFTNFTAPTSAAAPKVTITYGGKDCDMALDTVYEITKTVDAHKDVTCTLLKNATDITSTATINWEFEDTDETAVGSFTDNVLTVTTAGDGVISAKIGGTVVARLTVTGLAAHVD